MTLARLKEIRRLEKENAMLSETIAGKDLESKLKDELLKKKYPLMQRKSWCRATWIRGTIPCGIRL